MRFGACTPRSGVYRRPIARVTRTVIRTASPSGSHAWPIGKGWRASQAACVIHTDFEKGFIKAEVIGFDDLVETGSIAEARAKGKARIEGKEYVMQDGDVVDLRFGKT